MSKKQTFYIFYFLYFYITILNPNFEDPETTLARLGSSWFRYNRLVIMCRVCLKLLKVTGQCEQLVSHYTSRPAFSLVCNLFTSSFGTVPVLEFETIIWAFSGLQKTWTQWVSNLVLEIRADDSPWICRKFPENK